MKIGDVVIYRGVVTDIVGGSVLTRSSFDEREHWFGQDHLEVVGSPAESLAEIVPETAGDNLVQGAPTQTSDAIEKAVAIVISKGYSEEAARKIVNQIGSAVILKEEAEPTASDDNLPDLPETETPAPAEVTETPATPPSEPSATEG
jgi:hypothetical protein